MMTISMQEIERELPRYLEKRMVELLNNIMNGRPTKSNSSSSFKEFDAKARKIKEKADRREKREQKKKDNGGEGDKGGG